MIFPQFIFLKFFIKILKNINCGKIIGVRKAIFSVKIYITLGYIYIKFYVPSSWLVRLVVKNAKNFSRKKLSTEFFETWPWGSGKIWELIPPKKLDVTQNDLPPYCACWGPEILRLHVDFDLYYILYFKYILFYLASLSIN